MNQLFRDIASKLARELGMSCTEQQASNKCKSLKRSYKDIEDYNNKSGNDRKTHPFQSELDAILKKKIRISHQLQQQVPLPLHLMKKVGIGK